MSGAFPGILFLRETGLLRLRVLLSQSSRLTAGTLILILQTVLQVLPCHTKAKGFRLSSCSATASACQPLPCPADLNKRAKDL